MSANVSQPKPFQIAWNVRVFHVAVVVIVDGVIAFVGVVVGNRIQPFPTKAHLARLKVATDL